MAKKDAATATKGAGGLLGKLAIKVPAKAESNDTTPIIECDATPQQLQAMERLIGAKKQFKQAEATIAQSEEVLLPVCRDMRKKKCMDNQVFHSSIKVRMKGQRTKKDENGQEITENVELDQVTLSVANKYSEIPLGDGEKLEQTFGDEKDKCFQQITQIGLTEDGVRECVSTQDQEDGLLAKIVEAVGGEEKFAKLFSVKQFHKPTEYLHEESVKDAKLAAKYDKAVADGLLKPQKPSFKL